MNKYTKNCIGCIGLDKEQARTQYVFETKICRIVLRGDDQRAPPRMIIAPKKHMDHKTFYQSKETILDVFKCIHILTVICEKRFGMTRPNIAQLGNLDVDEKGQPTSDSRYAHVHFHFMPTYKSPFKFNEIEFCDERYGKPLNIDTQSGYNKKKPSTELLLALKKAIQDEGLALGLLTEENVQNFRD